MRAGIRLGVDVGEVRIGVAKSDPGGLLALPLQTVRRSQGAAGYRKALTDLAALVGENDVVEVVVGWPRSLAGHEGPAALGVRTFAHDLAVRIGPIPVRLVDERMSTVSAQAGYREQGLSTRRTRSHVDQDAAAIILQNALDHERRTGNAAGELVATERTEGSTRD